MPRHADRDDPDRAAAEDALKPTFMDGLRQRLFPAEFRIPLTVAVATSVPPDNVVARTGALGPDAAASLADVATCLWYLKTRVFKTGWAEQDYGDAEPQVRRALGRLDRGVSALVALGVEVQDKTGERYPRGGENYMRPVELVQVDGITHERIAETIKPVVYLEGHLVQRADVFVEVPRTDPQCATAPRTPVSPQAGEEDALEDDPLAAATDAPPAAVANATDAGVPASPAGEGSAADRTGETPVIPADAESGSDSSDR